MNNLSSHLDNINWPSLHLNINSELNDWWNMAQIEIASPSEGFVIYSLAYKEAADSLVESMKLDKTKINILIFPALYLYRHFIELALKDILNSLSSHMEIECNSLRTHNLSDIWRIVKKSLSKINLDVSTNDIEAAEKQILQFHQLDKSSMNFRYPIDTNGNVYNNLSDHINIENIRLIIDGLNNWFFGLSCTIDK